MSKSRVIVDTKKLELILFYAASHFFKMEEEYPDVYCNIEDYMEDVSCYIAICYDITKRVIE